MLYRINLNKNNRGPLAAVGTAIGNAMPYIIVGVGIVVAVGAVITLALMMAGIIDTDGFLCLTCNGRGSYYSVWSD